MAKPAKPTNLKPTQNSQKASRDQSGNVRQSFALITPNGRTQTFGSRLEAQAAYIRGGRAGVIRER